MAFREVRVFEVREVLRLWLGGEGLRATERLVAGGPQDGPPLRGRRGGAGAGRDGGEEQLTDVFVGAVVEAVRPHRADGHGEAWRLLVGQPRRRSRRGSKTEPDGGEDPRAAGPPRGGGAVAHGAALRRWRCATSAGAGGSDGAGRRRRAGRRVAGRLRPAGLDRRPETRPAAGSCQALIFTAGASRGTVRVVDVPADHRGRDRRVRGGVGVLRRRVRAP